MAAKKEAAAERQEKKPTLSAREQALAKRESELASAEALLNEKIEEFQAGVSELVEREKVLAEREAELKKSIAEVERRAVMLDEQENLLAEKKGEPGIKIRALRVTSKLARGFYRGGHHFTLEPTVVAASELSMEQLAAIRAESNLRVEEILA